MPSITRKQYNDINSKCSNDFSLDLHFYCLFGEKQLARTFQITNVDYISVTIFFQAKYENFRKVGFYPCVRFEKLHDLYPDAEPESKLYRSVDIKTDKVSDEIVTRRNMAVLYEITKKYTEDLIFGEMSEEIKKMKAAAA